MLAHIPRVLNAGELTEITRLLNAGGFRDGRVSAHGKARDVKNNLEFEYVKGRQSDIRLVEIVARALSRNRDFYEAAYPKIILPPIFNRYETGMSYGVHTDAPTMQKGQMRVDMSVTVFLSDPGSYDGGELVLDTGHGEARIKHPKGDAVVYPTTVLHRVAEVTRGVRLAAIAWVQSHVREEGQRRILHDLRKIQVLLKENTSDAPEAVRYRNALCNLERQWWEP